MIDKYEDLGLSSKDNLESVNLKLLEKLGIRISDLQSAVNEATSLRAEEISLDLMNIAPFGDYSKLMEDNDSMSDFLKKELKPEHWHLHSVRPYDTNTSLIQFDLKCDAIDDGETFKGYVFVSLSGKIRHAFAQGEP